MIREERITVSPSLSYQELRDIVAQASTITERLHGGFLVEDTPESEDLRQQQLDTWCRIVAKGDWKRFQEILSWDGYDIIDVQRVLGHVHSPEHAPLPVWTTTLQEMVHIVENMPCEHGVVDKSSWSFLAPDQPFPF